MSIEEHAEQFLKNMEVLRESDEMLYVSLKNKEVDVMRSRAEAEMAEYLLSKKVKEKEARRVDERNVLFEEHEFIKF